MSKVRSSRFLDVTQRRLVDTDVSGQPIGPIFQSQSLQVTSIINYQSTLRNIPKERKFHSQGGSLKS